MKVVVTEWMDGLVAILSGAGMGWEIVWGAGPQKVVVEGRW